MLFTSSSPTEEALWNGSSLIEAQPINLSQPALLGPVLEEVSLNLVYSFNDLGGNPTNKRKDGSMTIEIRMLFTSSSHYGKKALWDALSLIEAQCINLSQ